LAVALPCIESNGSQALYGHEVTLLLRPNDEHAKRIVPRRFVAAVP